MIDRTEEPVADVTSTGSESPASTTSRRDFLKVAGVGAAGAVLGSTLVTTPAEASGFGRANPRRLIGASLKPTHGMATGRAIGANDRINVGFVGVGGRGGDHLISTTDRRKDYNISSIAAADCYNRRRDGAKQSILARDTTLTAQGVQAETDYRRLLDNKDIDAIIIATPEHWHAQVAIDAMTAGKHVYIEKPMSRYLNEGFAVYDVAKRTGKVVQVGSQGCSDAKWWTAGRAIRDGKLGQIVSAQDSYTRNSTDGEWNYHIDKDSNPGNLDWNMWLGTAPSRPWNDDSQARFFRYRKFRDYSAGLLGDLLPHKAFPLMLAMFLDQPEFPIRVSSLGTRAISTDREVADTLHVLAEFPTGATMYVLLSTVNEHGIEPMIRGHKANLSTAGIPLKLTPERPFADVIDEAEIPVNGPTEDTNVHRGNWFDCIRNGKTPNCNIDLAIRAQALISMAEMSELGRYTVEFDPSRREMRRAGEPGYLVEPPHPVAG